MKRIKNFVKNTFKNIPKEKQEEIIPKVTEMLIEKVEDLMENGYSKDEAVNKTVLEFGTVEDYFSQGKIRKRKFKTVKHYRNDLIFSLFGALIIIGMLIFSNLYYTPDIIWFVLPMFAVLWWPLAIFYNFLNKKIQTKGEKDE